VDNFSDEAKGFISKKGPVVAVSELELSRAADVRAAGIWMDPTGTHAIVSIEAGNTLGASTEVHYVHAKWKKSRMLPKLKQKGMRITAIAWDLSHLSESSTGYVSRPRDSMHDCLHPQGFEAACCCACPQMPYVKRHEM
jgi:hypothetical protein